MNQDFAREWNKSNGYPSWVAALAFIAFIFVLACLGGIFAELVGWVVSLI